jgi:hypothetical protein
MQRFQWKEHPFPQRSKGAKFRKGAAKIYVVSFSLSKMPSLVFFKNGEPAFDKEKRQKLWTMLRNSFLGHYLLAIAEA